LTAEHLHDIYLVIDIGSGAKMNATAKLFKHGRSQAVRLPKECRFSGAEVRVVKVGERVILEPVEAAAGPMPWPAIDALGDTLFMPQGREQPKMPEERIVFEP
jgi:antitoxin VapB